MAKYLISSPSFVNGIFYPASNTDQREIELPDGTEPSRTWEPLDEMAKRDLATLLSPPEAATPSLAETTAPKPATVKKATAPKSAEVVPEGNTLEGPDAILQGEPTV